MGKGFNWMGKEISHILCAGQAVHAGMGSLGDRLRSVLSDALHSFHFGSIVADTFFYAVRLPFERKRAFCFGDAIHGSDGNDTSRPALEMLRLLRGTPNDPLFAEKAAFACGFLTHIALDSVLHPFVYHVSGNYYAACPAERNDARARHRLVESWLDLQVLRQASLELPGFTFLSDIRRNGVVNRELLRFFASVCADAAEDEPACWHDLRRGYRVQMALNALFGNRGAAALVNRADCLFAGRFGSFLALFYPWGYSEIPGEILHFDSYNHPVTGEMLKGGFDRLWSDALQRGKIFLAAADRFLFGAGNDDALGDAVQGFSLNTGLVGVPIRGAVHFDCIPLERLWSHGRS
jgi:hypothetical protein